MARRKGLIGYGSAENDLKAAQAAVHVLCAFLPEPERQRARRELVDAIDLEFRRSGMEVPEWIDRLRRAV